MTTELLRAVAQVIKEYCIWVKPVAMHEHQLFSFTRYEHLHEITSRCLTLEVTHSRGHHYIGHRWKIPEYQLEKVIGEMRCKSAAFRYRCKRLELTADDVETIINKASYGIIRLDMVNDDFKPIIQ